MFRIQAQTFVSTRPDYIRVKSQGSCLLKDFRANYPDTSITRQAEVAPRNFLGNMGLPNAPYLFSSAAQDPGFIFFLPFLRDDRFDESSLVYCRSAGPYASLNGITGAGQLQVLRMFFTHTIKDKLNLTIRFNRYTSTGFYKRQQTYTSNAAITGNQESKNRKSGYYFSFIGNSNKNNESGGITAPLNDVTVLQNKMLRPVYLGSANHDNRDNRIAFSPYLRLAGSVDSTVRPAQYLQLNLKVRDQVFQYRDKAPAVGYYPAILQDSLTTRDSVHLRQFDNELAYTIKSADGRKGISAGFRDEISQYWQRGNKLFRNQMLLAEAVIRNAKRQDSAIGSYWQVMLHSTYVASGYNSGDNRSVLTADLGNGRLWQSSLSLGAEQRRPDYFLLNWSGNNLEWQNNFIPRQQQFAEVRGAFRKWLRLSVLLQSTTNMLYFDRDAKPAQYRGTVICQQYQLVVDKVFFRHLGLYADYTHQASSKKSLMRFPDHAFSGKLYYAGMLFRNNLQLNIGTAVQLYSNFTPFAYMPATQAFYLQDGNRPGSYPYLDVYLSARIRPVSFFVTFQNVLRELAGKGYYLVPGYYQPERALRLGLTWVFFD